MVRRQRPNSRKRERRKKTSEDEKEVSLRRREKKGDDNWHGLLETATEGTNCRGEKFDSVQSVRPYHGGAAACCKRENSLDGSSFRHRSFGLVLNKVCICVLSFKKTFFPGIREHFMVSTLLFLHDPS